jgi:hypothetical protein
MSIMRTASGREVDLLHPDPASISIRDIANHLAKLNRYCGASETPISVAQHSLMVADIIQSAEAPVHLQMHGLLHDAAEAYMGDIIKPVKSLLDVKALESGLTHAIQVALNIKAPTALQTEVVAAADAVAFAWEFRDLMPGLPPPGTASLKHYDLPRIRCMAWPKAEEEFLRRFERLCILTGWGPQ